VEDISDQLWMIAMVRTIEDEKLPVVQAPAMVAEVSAVPARTAEREFLTLVYADDELVRAQFAALIDACWDDPAPPRQPSRPGPPADQPERHGARPAPAGRGRDGQPGRDGWHRQRSPPDHCAAG
jgi:hypothetical protein